MHLGLIDGPFVPHNLISTQDSPVPLLKFQMAPQTHFFSLKNHGKWNPNRTPMERDSCLQGICISLENPIKIPLNKKALRNKHPSMFPKSGTHMEADAHFRDLLDISFRLHSKGALHQGPLNGIPCRQMPRSYSPPSFILQNPWYMSPPPDSRFSSAGKGPPWREMPVSRAFLNTSSKIPSEGAPSPWGPLHGASSKRDAPSLEPLHPSLKVPGRQALLQEIDACLQSLFYITFRVHSMGALPPGSLHRAPTQRETPPSETLSTTSQSPW